MVAVIMPMAGRGSRFAVTGETIPKPLIPVGGAPMFLLPFRAIRGELPAAELICVVLREHAEHFDIAGKIRAALPGAKIAVVPEVTSGALETCLAAEAFVSSQAEPVIVADCDLVVRSPAYFGLIRAMAAKGEPSGGAVVSFRATSPRYSYAAVANGLVTRTAEKDPISPFALAGHYGFRSAALLFDSARAIIADGERTGNGEFYVSSAYNRLIAARLGVALAEATDYWSFGTPEELNACLARPEFHSLLGELEA
jgi:dTDP-glucose pyrophosphorylase